jgi:hypothetical protein
MEVLVYAKYVEMQGGRDSVNDSVDAERSMTKKIRLDYVGCR